jgi:hypothetical protein
MTPRWPAAHWDLLHIQRPACQVPSLAVILFEPHDCMDGTLAQSHTSTACVAHTSTTTMLAQPSPESVALQAADTTCPVDCGGEQAGLSAAAAAAAAAAAVCAH